GGEAHEEGADGAKPDARSAAVTQVKEGMAPTLQEKATPKWWGQKKDMMDFKTPILALLNRWVADMEKSKAEFILSKVPIDTLNAWMKARANKTLTLEAVNKYLAEAQPVPLPGLKDEKQMGAIPATKDKAANMQDAYANVVFTKRPFLST